MGRKQRGMSPMQAKQWKTLKKRYNDQMEAEREIKKQFENGTYEHPMYLTLQGVTEKDIKRKVGLETWEERMDREAEEMMNNESVN